MPAPVALLIFNRPDHTARVVSRIVEARPSKLLVVADGPRHANEAAACAAARAAVERVDWECEVVTNYSDENMGCGSRVASGLAWVFDHVEEAIVLEDDCLPDPSFFPYCNELLDRYRSDTRIMTVSGTNFLGSWRPAGQSYHFSLFPATWGWATWRRAWRHYDPTMQAWPDARDGGLLDSLFPAPRHRHYWMDQFSRTHRGEIDTWDYQWLLACWMQHSLQVIPSVNLVSNIGFGDQATHTFEASAVTELPTEAMAFPLKHPPFLFQESELDRRVQEDVFNPRRRRSSEAIGKLRRVLRGLRGR